MRKYTIILIVVLALALLSGTAFAKVKVGDLLPDFEMKDLEGKTIKVSDFRGKYVIFDVWATWCGYCIPVLEDYQKNLQKLEDAGIQVVAISVDTKLETVTNYLKKKDWEFTVTHDRTNNAGRIWGVTGIPAVFMVDPAGKVIYTHVGLNTFEAFWNDAVKAIDLTLNPPTRVSKLTDGTYKTMVTLVTEIYGDESLELDVPTRYFTDTAVRLKKQPAYQGVPKYAVINIGSEVIHLVADKTRDADVEDVLYIDLNADLDLTGEGEMQQMELGTDPGTGQSASRWVGEVEVKVDKNVTMRYQIICFFGPDYADYYIIPIEGYQAEVKTPQGVVKSWIIDLNANGKFNDAADLFWMDLNQNDGFDIVLGDEVFPATQILELSDGKYQLKIAETGKEIQVKTVK